MSDQFANIADPQEIAILLDDHADRVNRVRSVLWAASNLIRQAASVRSTSPTLIVELSQLIDTGLSLADDFSSALTAEREVQNCLSPC